MKTTISFLRLKIRKTSPLRSEHVAGAEKKSFDFLHTSPTLHICTPALFSDHPNLQQSYRNPIAADCQTGRVRRKRARLPSNGSIRTDPPMNLLCCVDLLAPDHSRLSPNVTHDLNSRGPRIYGLRVSRQLVAETRLIPGARRSVTRQEQSQLVLKNASFRRGFGLYNQMLAAKVNSSCNYTCMGSQSQASQTNRIKADNHIYVAHKR
jgi:hypothetical protein